MGWLASLIERKNKAIEELRALVGEEGFVRAKSDHHSRRKPRPCGMTIHTGLGCTNACLYCYAIDMGFPRIDAPYKLKPAELALAIALNPYVVPERTFAAFGSVVEPFLPNTAAYTIECMKLIRRYLSLPCQVSTKMVLSHEIASRLASCDEELSVLVTIVTMKRHSVLEPRAPPPTERLEGARIAIEHGLRVTLFLRPLIPGIIEEEYRELLERAWSAGIRSVVLGSLRITKGVLERLSRAGIDVSKIVSRAPRLPRSTREQITINCGDIKRMVEKYAASLGFTVFESACQANVWSHEQYCAACSYGPCGDYSKEPRIRESDVNELLELLGSRAKCEIVDRVKVVISGTIGEKELEILKQATRRRVVVSSR